MKLPPSFKESLGERAAGPTCRWGPLLCPLGSWTRGWPHSQPGSRMGTEAGSGFTLLPSRAQEWDCRSSKLRVEQSGWRLLDRDGGSQVPRWFPAGVGAGLQGCSSFSQQGNDCMQSTPTLLGKLLSKSLPGLRNTERAQGCCPLPRRHAERPQQVHTQYVAQGKSDSCGHILRVLVSGSPPQTSWGCRGSSAGSALHPTDMHPSPAPNRVSSRHCLGVGGGVGVYRPHSSPGPLSGVSGSC